MGAYVVGVLLALVAAVAVIVVASRGSDEGTSWRTFVADFKAGWRDRKNKVPEPEPVDVPFDELFDAEARPGDDYLQLDEFAELIERTGDRAGQIWHHDRGEEDGLPRQDRGPWLLHPRGHRTDAARGEQPHGDQPHAGPGRTDTPEQPTTPPRAPRRTSISSQH